MAALVDLGRLSRFETPETLVQIGEWAAVRHPRTILTEAFGRVTCDGVLPLLCVVDVVLKFSQTCEDSIASAVPGWLAKAARVIQMNPSAHVTHAEALVLAWVEHGLVSPACASAFAVYASREPARGVGDFHSAEDAEEDAEAPTQRWHACQVCRRRFSNSRDCWRHMGLHADARARARTSYDLERGTSLGLFQGFDEKRKTAKALKMQKPTRACSPVAIRPADARVCPRCGDSFRKAFSDVHNGFVWEGVTRDEAGTLTHDGCATPFFGSTA